jgi:hypothetical protein
MEKVSGSYDPAGSELGAGRGRIQLPPKAQDAKVWQSVLSGNGQYELELPADALLQIVLKPDGSFVLNGNPQKLN